MDPKRDFRLHGAAFLASEANGSEWEYEGSDKEDDLELSPTTGRVLTPPERLIKHGTVERGTAYCLPRLAEAEAFNITDVDGGQLTGLLYNPGGLLGALHRLAITELHHLSLQLSQMFLHAPVCELLLM
eukprot:jgi/Tetstr1/432287/TSEL_021689.t1